MPGRAEKQAGATTRLSRQARPRPEGQVQLVNHRSWVEETNHQRRYAAGERCQSTWVTGSHGGAAFGEAIWRPEATPGSRSAYDLRPRPLYCLGARVNKEGQSMTSSASSNLVPQVPHVVAALTFLASFTFIYHLPQ